MNRLEALEQIKAVWVDETMPLGQRIVDISSAFSSAGLDLATTAAFIHATPAELDFFLALGELDDETIEAISELNPPKTTWVMLASANDEELESALAALRNDRNAEGRPSSLHSVAEYLYVTMVEVEGPTIEQKVGNLPGDTLRHALKKGEDFKALGAWDAKFLKSVAGQKKRGKVLSDRQVNQLIRILGELADAGAIVRNSIDGDADICDDILDALGR